MHPTGERMGRRSDSRSLSRPSPTAITPRRAGADQGSAAVGAISQNGEAGLGPLGARSAEGLVEGRLYAAPGEGPGPMRRPLQGHRVLADAGLTRAGWLSVNASRFRLGRNSPIRTSSPSLSLRIAPSERGRSRSRSFSAPLQIGKYEKH